MYAYAAHAVFDVGKAVGCLCPPLSTRLSLSFAYHTIYNCTLLEGTKRGPNACIYQVGGLVFPTSLSFDYSSDALVSGSLVTRTIPCLER